MNQKQFICGAFIFANTVVLAQEKKLEFNVSVSPMWQSTVMNFFNFRSVGDPSTLYLRYRYEKNIQGVGANAAFQLYSPKHRLGFEFSPTLRYDYVYSTYTQQNNKDQVSGKDINDIIFNFGFSLYWNPQSWQNKQGVRHLAGLGYNIVNIGKRHEYYNSWIQKNEIVVYQLETVTGHYTLPIKSHFIIEPKFYFIPRGFPKNKENKYIFYSLKVGYRF